MIQPREGRITDGNDFKLFGFVSRASQRGLLKLMFGMFVVIILSQQGWIAYQNYRYDEMVNLLTKAGIVKDDKTTDILIELLRQSSKTKNNFDSAVSR